MGPEIVNELHGDLAATPPITLEGGSADFQSIATQDHPNMLPSTAGEDAVNALCVEPYDISTNTPATTPQQQFSPMPGAYDVGW